MLAGKWGNGDNRKKDLEAAGTLLSGSGKVMNWQRAAPSKKSVTQIAKEGMRRVVGVTVQTVRTLTCAGYDYIYAATIYDGTVIEVYGDCKGMNHKASSKSLDLRLRNSGGLSMLLWCLLWCVLPMQEWFFT